MTTEDLKEILEKMLITGMICADLDFIYNNGGVLCAYQHNNWYSLPKDLYETSNLKGVKYIGKIYAVTIEEENMLISAYKTKTDHMVLHITIPISYIQKNINKIISGLLVQGKNNSIANCFGLILTDDMKKMSDEIKSLSNIELDWYSQESYKA